MGGTGKDKVGEEDDEEVERRRGGDVVDEEEEELRVEVVDNKEMAGLSDRHRPASPAENAASWTRPSLAQMTASGRGGDEMLRGNGNREKMSSEISGSFAAADAAAADAVPALQSSSLSI